MTPSITRERLQAQIAAFRPQSILCIGRQARDWAAAYRRNHPDCRVEVRDAVPSLAELETAPRRDLVLVSDLAPGLSRAGIEQALARLRDLGGTRLIVALPACADDHPPAVCWKPANLFALGLIRLGELAGEPCQDLYAFDLAAYKTTPDWLNSRYWAHPELWGKYWW